MPNRIKAILAIHTPPSPLARFLSPGDFYVQSLPTSTSATAAHTFDITNLCRSWYKKDADGNSQNKGIAVRYISDCGTSDKYVQWYATTGHTVYCPRLVVDYVSHAGLESWWQYEQMSAGRAGTAYVDIYNGNLVYEHADTATSGNLMPVSVSHYYNSCLSESDPVYCGMGWRTSMNQSVYKTTLPTAPRLFLHYKHRPHGMLLKMKSSILCDFLIFRLSRSSNCNFSGTMVISGAKQCPVTSYI